MHLVGDPIFDSIIEASADATLVVDRHGIVQVANTGAAELFGSGRSDLVGSNVDRFVPDSVRDLHERHRRRFLDDPRTRPMGIGMLLEAQRSDGTVVPVEVSLSPIATADGPLVIVAVRDVTARVEAERAVAIAVDRARIARDLHDNIIQRLFASGLALEVLSSKVDEPHRGRLGEVIVDLDATIGDIRDVIFDLESDLRDLAGDSGGMRGRLEAVIDRITSSTEAEVTLALRGPIETLSPRVAAELLPSLSEALSNVIRHAQARRIRVDVEVGSEVVLRVDDDGIGLDRSRESETDGLGLENLRRRAEQLGGGLDIWSRDPRGTVVVWSVPS